MTPSIMDVVLGCSETHVADAQELRRKREEDTVACGQQVRTVLQSPKVRSTLISMTSVDVDEDDDDDARTSEEPSKICKFLQKSSRKQARTGKAL